MGELRDIRSDLRARLEDLQQERRAFEERMAEREHAVRAMLELEEARWGGEPKAISGELQERLANLVARVDARDADLARVVRTALSSGPLSLGEIAEYAVKCGVEFGGKSPGRVLHFVLLNLQRAGQVDRDESGVWRTVVP